MKTLTTLILTLFLLSGFKQDNLRTVTGSVTDESNMPIAGATIKTLPSNKVTVSDKNGNFKMAVLNSDTALQFQYLGYQKKTVKLSKTLNYVVKMVSDQHQFAEVVTTGYVTKSSALSTGSIKISGKDLNGAPAGDVLSLLHGKVAGLNIQNNSGRPSTRGSVTIRGLSEVQQSNESYKKITENGFHQTVKNPLSTFSIDVDAASYSNVRRYLNNGNLPPKDAVRIEEMINYFDYDYDQPKGNDPVNIVGEIAPAPWNPKHRLVHIGLQAKTFVADNLPASNLVFLIDVSGSMSAPNKLPLLVSSLRLLTNQLREKDKVAIVVYAGSAGLVLPSTSGDNKTTIKEALDKLSAGGSTAGGAGIKLAYDVASKNFVKGGNNRVILATDGDFNVGANSDGDMENLIEEKRKSGVFLTVLGFGMGNYKDSKMEALADKGNGNYAYIDNISEARKVLISEFGGTLFTVAKDVKLQIEFNPTKVQAYRLIGYENRLLNDEDFNDDVKDAGEMGSGHSVTALYEIIPVGEKNDFIKSIDPLKYQKVKKSTIPNTHEVVNVKLRYKDPNGTQSKLLQKPIIENNRSTSADFNFIASVAEFGMLLRQSGFKQNSSFDNVIALAQASLGTDKEGYRAEFLKLVKSTKLLAKDLSSFTSNKKED
jgi:Ca-activated chloride channel family protein